MDNDEDSMSESEDVEKSRPETVVTRTDLLESVSPGLKDGDKHNKHVDALRNVRERFDPNDDTSRLMIILKCDRKSDGRTENLPATNEVAALIPNDFNGEVDARDIIIECKKTGNLKRISELHPAYLPLQYPLLFPYGEDGFRLGIDIGFVDTQGRKRLHITMREFFAYRIQERVGESPIIPLSGRLFQQFLVDAYTMIETNRLRFISMNQSKLHCENYDKIKKTVDGGDIDLSDKGKRIIIPSSYTGGTRYMVQHYLDAMTTCQHFGFPDLFITFTCNPKWPEITRHLKRHNLKQDDRPDICTRVFKMKLDDLMHRLTKENVLGVVKAAIYTIEFQKRGLPHALIVLFLEAGHKLPTGDDIDKIICAEILDKDIDPALYEIVGDVMMHGPCGAWNKDSVCMAEGKCTKYFPKPYSPITKIDDVGYLIYRRRNDKKVIVKKGIECDNGFVVPYNRSLTLLYRAHINVEWCVQSRSVKYLFKYIHKGADYIRATVKNDDKENEIKKHFNCRYVAPSESTWRIFRNHTHHRTVSVIKLPFHLPNQQMVIYNEDDPGDEVINRVSVGTSKFIAWMECNDMYELARTLTYAQFPTRLVWNNTKRIWTPRSRRVALGRITYVPIGAAVSLSQEQVKDFTLVEIELLLRVSGRSLKEFTPMPFPEDITLESRDNPLIRDERNYNRETLRVRNEQMLAIVTSEQRSVYDEILEAVNKNKGVMFFVYGSGGTGKTYLWSLLGSALRSQGDVVLKVASSGIAALLLEGGRTAHSRFAIPIVVNKFTFCSIKKESNLADLIRIAKLIIWDEALMMSKDCFETLDRTMRDILEVDKPFGDKVIVLGGDFRQILPVIPNAGRQRYLWPL
ncbi:uncharacterized protein LOC112083106 [Eutrema salsugineum]|uniref:uncharacterized protein LOC112083106 n=1 Tax=Eutrema salsugineum TaxID=72664 RepID=UPI000CED3B93|nr:uncharacterized protein LOC112083106 [Eutrema salsugineum]